MTTTSVLSTIELHEEWKSYCKAEGLPCISATELVASERLTAAQRFYVKGFIARFEETSAREEQHPTLCKTVTHFRGLAIEGVAYEPAVSGKELENLRRQIALDVERRNRNLHPRDIGLVMAGEQA